MRPAVDLDLRRFGAALGEIGEVVVGALAGTRQVIERGLDRVVIAARQAIVDRLDQSALPQLILQAAAGFGQAPGHFDQRFGVDRLARAGARTVAAHGMSS